MTTHKETKHTPVDRQGWPPGPWDQEGDREEWVTRAGLHAIANRVSHWCGYVAVPPGHPCHGKSDSWDGDEPSPIQQLDVHGGVTYTNACHGEVCHVPPPGEPADVWWIGFDCGHGHDMTPTRAKYDLDSVLPGRGKREEYRDIQYVRGQCESLAEQLQAMTTTERRP
jgi:hypothetical protein